VIDTHIHLFDPSRPQGVPWPNKNNPAHKVMYMPSLPSRYRTVVDGLGIVGAIEIECSGWLEDNQWVLDVAQADDIMVAPWAPDAWHTGIPAESREVSQEPAVPRHPVRAGEGGGKEFDRPEFVAT